jgi:hypothetical protein
MLPMQPAGGPRPEIRTVAWFKRAAAGSSEILLDPNGDHLGAHRRRIVGRLAGRALAQQPYRLGERWHPASYRTAGDLAGDRTRQDDDKPAVSACRRQQGLVPIMIEPGQCGSGVGISLWGPPML